MLEDVATDVVLINHELREGGLAFHAKRVETRDDFKRELERHPPDLILSDHGLPSFDGFSALAIAHDRCPDTPFIFVTGSMGEELAIDSLRGGATDYVLKSRLKGLVPAVQRALRLAEERRKRKQAERDLRESEERFRLLVGGVKDYAIVMLDPDGRISSWNAGAELIMGHRAGEIIGEHFGRFYPVDERGAGKPARDLATAATEGLHREEGWRVRQGDSPFWAQVDISALRDEAAKLRGFTLVTRDVTERMRAQEALRKSEERYRRLVELCPDALLVVSGEHIAFVNTAAQKLLGATDPAQLEGKPLADFVPPAGRDAVARRLREILERGSASPWSPEPAGQPLPALGFIEDAFVRLDGSIVAVETAAIRLTFQNEPALQLIAHDITDRLAAAAALRESEMRKTAILETSLDAIVSIDHGGIVREWNPAAEKIFGYPRAAALGQRLDALIVPQALREKYLPGLSDYLMTGVGSLIGRPIELVARRADSTEFSVELAITQITASNPPFFTAFMRDITDRKQAEGALRRSEARKAAVVETALDAIVSIDHEGRIIEWNPAAEKTFGYSRELALGRDMADLIVPRAALGAHRKGLARYLKTGRGRLIGQRTELSARRANGAEFPVELTLTRIPGDGPVVFTSFVRDITERRRTEEALRKSEERFRLIVESAEDYAIYMLDTHGRVTTWNSGAQRLYGYRAPEIVGRRFSRFYTPQDLERKKPEQALAVATAEGRFQQERWNVRKDGTRFWSSGVITALRDDRGTLYGFSKIARDVTARKETEDQIRRLNAELEARVEARTAELQAAYKEMEAFSYSISHDLRAPVMHISGFVEMLEGEIGAQLDAMSRHHLDTIRQSARQMAQMISDLLSFARTGRAELRRVRFNLADIFREAQRDLAAETKDRRVTLIIGDLPEATGDPFLLRQAVFNLMANALKYTRPRPEAVIEVGGIAGPEETEVFIRDNGVGFDMKYADKLFGVFQRLHSAAEFEGTGIGLANVRRIIQRHGGRTWAEGTVDAGAVFHFTLPHGKEAPRERE